MTSWGRSRAARSRPARELHHLHAGRPDVDRHVLGPSFLVDVVELDAVEVDVVPVEGDRLVGQQPADRGDHFAHRPQRLRPIDADPRRQRIPPRAETADDPAGSEVVEGRERAGETSRVARPDVDDARPDADAVGAGGEGRHRHDGIAHEPAVGLPDRGESLRLGLAGVLQALPDPVGVLQIEGDGVVRHHRILTAG
jgi:hypothetical protein